MESHRPSSSREACGGWEQIQRVPVICSMSQAQCPRETERCRLGVVCVGCALPCSIYTTWWGQGSYPWAPLPDNAGSNAESVPRQEPEPEPGVSSKSCPHPQEQEGGLARLLSSGLAEQPQIVPVFL